MKIEMFADAVPSDAVIVWEPDVVPVGTVNVTPLKPPVEFDVTVAGFVTNAVVPILNVIVCDGIK